MDSYVALGLLIGAFIVAPLLIWLIGGFNPIGYLGVPPWRVPRCEACGQKTGVGHIYQCPGGTR
jgi:hypothetical protein